NLIYSDWIWLGGWNRRRRRQLLGRHHSEAQAVPAFARVGLIYVGRENRTMDPSTDAHRLPDQHQILHREETLIVGAQRPRETQRRGIVRIYELVAHPLEATDRLIGNFRGESQFATQPGERFDNALGMEPAEIVDE